MATSTDMISPMKRQGYGTIGRAFPVLVNTFKVKPPTATCYHYDFKIGPEDAKRPSRVNREVWKHFIKSLDPFQGIACVYDGKAQVFAPKKLLADEGSWNVNLPESDGRESKFKGNQFTIKIKYIRPVHLDALSAFVSGKQTQVDEGVIESCIQALNIVIQHGPFLSFSNSGASFFLPFDNPQAGNISKGLTMWRGYYSSLRCGPSCNFILLDLASQPFYQEGDLPKLLVDGRAKDRSFGPDKLESKRMPGAFAVEANRFIRALRISINVGSNGPPMIRKIRELTRQNAQDSKFQNDEGKTTDVAEYFRNHYNIRLQHPEWPCVKISSVALYPIEICTVLPGQKYSRKLDPTQTAESLKRTTVGPRDRVPLLRQGIQRILPTNAGSPLNQWGMEFTSELMQVQARLLPNPTVTLQRPVIPRDGVWDLRGQQFNRPCAPIERWTVFVFDQERFFRRQEVEKSVSDFARGLQNVGIKVRDSRPAINYAPALSPANIPAYFRETVKGLGLGGAPQLLLIYLARKPCDEYAAIKRFGDLDVGVVTQCLSVPKAKRGNPQYYANLALKVNCKLSGINSIVDLGPACPRDVPTMIIGADVTHPGPGSFAPSIAAVVATMNREFTNYGSRIHVQSSRVELISDLEGMMMELLRQFHSTNRVPPARLIFYRDGVSEGQFAQVLSSEVAQIRSACQKIDPNYNPTISFVVCGKRHHLSLFPLSGMDGDKTGNVKAGTCVDTDVTSPFEHDFYIQSHASLLGTSRSAHYNVLLDDAKISADAWQQLTFNLTFTYARASRSVSVTTPAYYADRLCTRAALYLAAESDDAMSQMSSLSGASAEQQQRERLLAEYRNRLGKIHSNHKDALFFM
ncbi:BZ3500_MvSof-1268-A1-R1_Chr1-2g01288 [Microbotryum saponariae]|uniref:BZ3500_MvSof-1268-A1-R1_Chr1-2g01288 protein n=1 Tax=Microbotryum saponariae TaxID=289078 RepID=A0A2X0KVA6_9BASI|nr:BZ3500_MvSof-1268-A1-R1_Chr1-2g01288 [Microbotryum saponariae]SCZ96987.1 BZ3501_MvSof-1269-A2-R1_Chr1-2g00886 [Microbotryum saponariae]